MPDATQANRADHVHETSESTPIEGTEKGQEQQTQEAAAKTYTEEEVQALLQAEADRRVTKALEKQKREADEQRLKEEGKFQELYENLLKEKERAEFHSKAQSLFIDKQFPELTNIFLSDLSNLDNLSKAADALNAIIQAKVQAQVQARLETGKPVVNAGPKQSLSELPLEELLQKAKTMTAEEIAQFRKEHNYH